jgi:hypothetical protein
MPCLPANPTSPNPTMQIVPVPSFIDSISGQTITGGEVNDDGLHLYLDDGRVLIILGVVCVGELEKETLQ